MKKDDSARGLSLRLMAIGFIAGDCQWILNGVICSPSIGEINMARLLGCDIEPNGHHPSTIGVATHWLRSFPKIGNSFSVVFIIDLNRWLPCLFGNPIDYGYDSELEALVEFAEWAKEEGLMS